jgi:hypothetical protein
MGNTQDLIAPGRARKPLPDCLCHGPSNARVDFVEYICGYGSLSCERTANCQEHS